MIAMLAAMTDGFGQYWYADLLRIAVIASCVWLAFLVVRLAWIRRMSPGPDQPHMLTSLSYAAGLLLISWERVERWEHPPDTHLVLALIVVACGMTGVMLRVRFHAPGRSRRRPRDAAGEDERQTR